jgi:3'-phosphoadenosine 5'-phosphosulfate (PAPS) 3'-phosphatase
MESALSGFRMFAARLANDAAAVSMPYFRRHPDTGTKPDRSPGTIGDVSI